MQQLAVEKAVFNDLDAIEAIYNESIDWLNSRNIHQWQRGVYPTRSSAQAAVDGDCLYRCSIEGQMAGTFIMNEVQPPQYQTLNWKYPGPVMALHTLVIRPCNTGQGIGRRIVKYVIEQARKNKYRSIRLDAFPDNLAAIKLYQLFGFEYVGKVFFDNKEAPYEWYNCYELKL